MRQMIIDGIDFYGLEIQKYWQPPASWSNEKKKKEAHDRIFSGDWLGSWKHDGAFYSIVKDMNGDTVLIGRSLSVSGDYIDKLDHLPQIHDWVKTLPNGTCLLGEVYWPGKEGAKNTTSIMNCLTPKAIDRQKEEQNKLHYFVFDCLAWDGKSMLKTKAVDRFDMLNTVKCCTLEMAYVEYAEYWSGKKLWGKLQELLADGFEGAVLTKADSLYEPGKRPSKTTMKIKKEIKETLDVFFTGGTMPPKKEYTGKNVIEWPYWVNTITGEKLKGLYSEKYDNGAPIMPVTKSWYMGMVGSLEIGVVKGDKVVPIGYLSGLTEEIKLHPEEYKGRPIEVSAMEVDGVEKTLRHGKMIGFRDDLTIKDCTWEKCFGDDK